MELIYKVMTFLAFVLSAVSIYILKRSLPTYFQEKSKNLATKQDIEEITEKVKKVEYEYESQTKTLSFLLEQKAHVREVQFNKEHEAYVEIWSRLAEIKNIINSLLPLSEMVREEIQLKGSYSAHINNKSTELKNAFEKYQNIFMKYRPFYPNEIYETLSELETMIDKDYSVLKLNDLKDGQQLSKLLNSIAAINGLINSVPDRIRNRLESLS